VAIAAARIQIQPRFAEHTSAANESRNMSAQQLLQQLQAALGGDPGAISAKTDSLQAAGGAPGTSTSLVQIGQEPQVEFGVRQLALLVRSPL